LERRIDGRAIVYLDSAATSLTPRSVLEAQHRFATTIGASVHRAHHALAQEASEAFEGARRTVARFLGADPACVVFVRGATEGLNVVAAGLALSKDDIVAVPVAE